jgi:predicted Zn-dependent peptidase
VQNDVAAPALTDLMRLLTEYQNGISEDELNKAQSAWRTRSVASMESRSSIASNFAAIIEQGLPASTIADELAKAKGATVTTVNKAIQSSDVSNAIVVIAGDMDIIKASIQDAFPNQGRLVEPAK